MVLLRLHDVCTTGKLSQSQLDEAEDRSERAEQVIAVMMPDERSNPELLIGDATSSARQRRIAKDCGLRQQDVATFIREFVTMRTMMSK
jgi:signal recognition particle GTPase